MQEFENYTNLHNPQPMTWLLILVGTAVAIYVPYRHLTNPDLDRVRSH